MLRPLGAMSPRRIGPYAILARLGGGGMGDVYLGRRDGEHQPDALVAVKTMRPHLVDDPSFRDRFRRETELAGTVRGPCTAMPVAADADADPPWLATRYIAGPTLGAALRRCGPFPEDAVRALGADLALALAELHTAGIVHRDVKPGNVLLDRDRALLIDFGLARISGTTTQVTSEGGVLLGTPDFMSPEQLRDSRTVTSGSDVFSLGALLCFAATGVKPFGDGPAAAVQHRIAQGAPALDAVPEGLRDIIGRCLDPVPARRPRPDELAERWGAGTRWGGWPVPVREHVEEYRREAREVCAAAVPLPAPGPPDRDAAMAPRSPEVRNEPSVDRPSGVSEASEVGHEPPPGSRGQRRRVALALILALVSVVGAGTWLWRAGPWRDGTDSAPPARGPVALPAGVDDRGTADSSRVLPRGPAGTPPGWRPWRGRLAGPALGCAAGTKVLVCRLTDGTYTALDPADGRRLWTIGSYDPGTDSYISPTGLQVFPAQSSQPTVHGRNVVLSTDGWLQARDARTGKLRWERESAGALAVRSRPLVGDGMVFTVTSPKQDAPGVTPRLSMTAFALSDGRELWTRALSAQEYARAELLDFEPVAYADGLVHALSDGGLVSYDGRTGAARGQAASEAKGCDTLAVTGRAAFCSHQEDRATSPVLHRLDATTLQPVGRPMAPKGPPMGYLSRLAAVDDRIAVVLAPGAAADPDLGVDEKVPGVVVLLDPRTGAERGRYPLSASAGTSPLPSGADQVVTDPMIVGDAVVYADHSALHVIPLTADGRPGRARVVPVAGAPGPRPEERYDRVRGLNLAREIRPPVMIPLGDAVLIVYDKGTIVSVPLPE
ncbi:PQQ-binding-like beta-propeller repeat protein [Streptomyces sp. NPDC020965]|uniref:protein kinase domain-containing protein n=1 Tax=Streptomyces sp. NPDC020965 TaxID=3365105 RepID=UPI00379A0C14